MSLLSRSLAKSKHTITLQNRDIVSPLFGTPDFDETFTDTQSVKAIIKTPKGKTYFDGVSTEFNITHEIIIAYVAGVTAETWILFGTTRIDILAVANCCEDDTVLRLTCNDRGDKEASKS